MKKINNNLYLRYDDKQKKYFIFSDYVKLIEKEFSFFSQFMPEAKLAKYEQKDAISFECKSKLLRLDEIKLDKNYELFFQIAINISKAVLKLHKKHIFHANLNKESIFLDEQYNVYIFNFSHATKLNSNSTGLSSVYFKHIPLIEKSPEQLGRINHEVDLRSDIYNLGIIFYELLVKKHPFYAKDKLEILHLILTKEIDVIEDIPFNISNIISKLLQKNVSNRYQSLYGLIHDLKELKKDYLQPFNIAKKDISSRLQFPPKVYGRDDELELLMQKYKEVCNGNKKTLFISGYSGVGKSALINELKRGIINTNSYFISSKFDQYKQGMPYYAIRESFDLLVKQILTKDEKELNSLRKELLTNLKDNGQILIDVVPSIEQIIGKQKEVIKLPANESENRFNQVFLTFLKTVATLNNSLVFVIDDLQWMDLATLKLLENIINDTATKHIFILAAYRSNEVDNNFTLKNIINYNTNVQILKLEALDKSSLGEFLKDTLFLEDEDLAPLVDEVHLKTGSNPFYFRQFIKKIYDDSSLYFDFEKERWAYNIKIIKEQNTTNNVVELMLKNIGFIKGEPLRCLQIASCLGASFDLRELQRIEDRDIETIIEKMKEVFVSGFLIPLNVNINNHEEINKAQNIKVRFLHDQVQQAVYSTIKKNQLVKLHYQIGKMLLANKDQTNNFEILTHLNFSKELYSKKEKLELIDLNIQTANIAKSSTAYNGALSYLNFARQLLEEFDLDKYHNLYVDILLDIVELLYLTSDFEEANKQKDYLFSIIQDKNDEVRLRRILTVQYTRMGKLDDAIDEGLKSLAILGVHISKDLSFDDVGSEIMEVQEKLRTTPFNKIVKLKPIEDKNILKILDLLMEMQPCAYNSGSLIFPITILRLLKLTIDHGNSYLSYYVYMMYALMNTKVLKDYDMAFEAAKYALEIRDHFPKTILTGRVNMMLSNFVMPWQNKIKDSKELRAKAYNECLEYGDYYWGIHSYIFGFYANLLTVKDLDELYTITQDIASISKKINQISQYYLCNMQINLLNILRGNLDNFTDLNHEKGFEKKALEEYDKQNYMCAKYDFIVARLMQGFLFENYKGALEISLNKNLDPTSLDEGIFHEAFYKVFNILSILMLDITGDLKDEKDRYYKYIDNNIHFISLWKKHSPDIFTSVDALIKALNAWIKDDMQTTIEEFENSINHAKQNNLILFEAIANELYAKYWQKKGNEKISKLYFNEAIIIYENWKAYAKANKIRENIGIEKKDKCMESIDLDVIIKSSNEIIKDINLEKKIQTILEIVYKFSGAENGFIFLCNNDTKPAAKIDEQGFKYYLDQKIKDIKIPTSVINYIKRTKELLLSNDINTNTGFKDEYLKEYNPLSVLGIPLILNNELKAIIYLESYTQKNIFSSKGVDILKLLSTQMVIAIENSHFYQKLESLVEKRTHELENTLSLFDLGDILLFKWEYEDGWPVSYISNNVKNILGYDKEDFLLAKIKYSDIIHNEDIQRVTKDVQNAQENKKQEFKHKAYRLRHKDGHYIWIYDSTKIVYTKNGQIDYYLGYILDVTEQIKNQEMMYHQSKIASLGEMLRNISHQWRQPLSVISVTATGTKLKNEMQALNNEELIENLDHINKTAQYLSQTIDDFRSFFLADTTSKENVLLQNTIEKAFSLIKDSYKSSNIEVIKNFEKNDVYKVCNENLLIQALLNILNNARDALENINLEDKFVFIDLIEQKDELIISIKDNAKGIDEGIIDKIFEPYFTTKHKSLGTGIGLYMTNQIMTKHLNADIYVENSNYIHDEVEYTGALFKIVMKKENN